MTNMVGEHGSTDLECGVHLESTFLPPVSTFEYGQRLPSLESSSSAPIGRCAASGLSSHSLFAWQPFGSNSLHSHSQASSLQGQGGHLFPLVTGSVGSYGSEFTSANSPSPTNQIAISCGVVEQQPQQQQPKSDQQFVQLGYPNVTTSAGGRLRASVTSPSGQSGGVGVSTTDVQQPVRMDLGLVTVNPSVATPLPPYTPSGASSNSQSSTPAHQGFGFTSNGSGGLGQSGNSSNSLSGQMYDDSSKVVTIKQRSKKESHNRIERKRRDYINSQIVYLSSLLPPELYRDVDGRRNKGSVLRLSVNYIMELREAVSRMAGLKQENSLARQLIPLLLKRIESLERTVLEQGGELRGGSQATTTQGGSSSAGSMSRSPASFETLYQSWLLVNESNQRASNNSNGSNITPASSSRNSRVSSNSVGGGGGGGADPAHYFQDMMQTDTESELDSNVSVRFAPSSQPRVVNVKREQVEEDRLAESAPSRVRLDARRLGISCALRSNFTDLSTPDRIDEEITPLDSGAFENQARAGKLAFSSTDENELPFLHA
ncbi:unnamed protein product [Calicophoron daubneyi]|uniref:BHLH domain-containing protein n=1 Tax=Calicophoron daubneyi TaxID=300641 RepID=A0AAV2TZK4_CALDB